MCTSSIYNLTTVLVIECCVPIVEQFIHNVNSATDAGHMTKKNKGYLESFCLCFNWNYNHGQKSWDFFSIHTRLTPPPTLTNNIERVYPQFFSDF